MKRGLVAVAISSLLLTLVSPTGAVASGEKSEAMAGLNGPKLVWDGDFPDPGFAKLGSTYYLFQTGRGFKNTTSSNPKGPYGARKVSMLPEHEPSWMGDSGAPLHWRAWAPNVYATTHDDRPLYVMYFTAWHETRKTNCIGVATSRLPRTGYKYVKGSTICSPWADEGYEAIDPTHYRSVAGTRYLIYKTSDRNLKHWQIRAVRMNKYGTLPASPKADRAKTYRSEITFHMESPSILLHNHKVWMFTSRRNYAKGCEYYTDVWKADEFWNGRFRRVKTLMTEGITGLCGPGGAQVIKSGTRTLIAFHAWKDPNHPYGEGVRRAYVGELGWNSSGNPYLLK